jgi:hypothetical protein
VTHERQHRRVPPPQDRECNLSRPRALHDQTERSSGRAGEALAFSDKLEGWLTSDSPKTIGHLGDVFAENSFAVAVLLLMFVPALPAPTGGITHVLELIAMLLGAQMMLGRRKLWLPRRWCERELGSLTTGKALPFVIRRVRNVERWSRPRATILFRQRLTLRVLGSFYVTFALAAFVAPPFSGLDTLPALGAVLISLAIILEDGLLLSAGVMIGTLGIALVLTVGASVLELVNRLW